MHFLPSTPGQHTVFSTGGGGEEKICQPTVGSQLFEGTVSNVKVIARKGETGNSCIIFSRKPRRKQLTRPQKKGWNFVFEIF